MYNLNQNLIVFFAFEALSEGQRATLQSCLAEAVVTGDRAVVGVVPFGAATAQLGGWADTYPTAATVGKAEFDEGRETR
jgi:hypothetical protein